VFLTGKVVVRETRCTNSIVLQRRMRVEE
jgi:hypothetical protein